MLLEKEYLDKYGEIKLDNKEQETLNEWEEFFNKKEYPIVGELTDN